MRKSVRYRLLFCVLCAQGLVGCIWTDPHPKMTLHTYDYPGSVITGGFDTNIAAGEDFQTTDTITQVLAYYQTLLPDAGWQTLNVQPTGITSTVTNGTPPNTATYKFRLELITNPAGPPIYHIGLSNEIN